MAGLKAYIAERIFTGEEWLNNHAVIVEDNRIKTIRPVSALPAALHARQFNDCILVPSFIDLQIYGAYGKLLSVYPEADSLHKLREYCEKGGAAYCLATAATNTREVFYQCIDAVRDYWAQQGKGILGLHLEGPWINPLKRGAHIESLIHPPSLSEVKELLDYGEGIIKMITLAPEVCSREVIELILSYDITISAGHSNATYAEAMQGFDHGIRTVTHLYNAMSPLLHREPGLVGAAMDHPSVMSSIIPDGFHVDLAAIRIAKQAMKERLFVITDAVTETSDGPYQHYLAGDKYEASSILSGSALTMDKALQNLVIHAGIEIAEALRMCSLYPSQAIGLDKETGRIAEGYRVAMTVLDQSLQAIEVIS